MGKERSRDMLSMLWSAVVGRRGSTAYGAAAMVKFDGFQADLFNL
jgi:hypothetical protein